MTEEDVETFERFARRLADIEGEVKDPPPLDVSGAGTAIGLRPSVRSISRALGLVTVVVVAAAVVIPFVGGGPTSPPKSSPQVGVGGLISPSPASPSPTPTEQGLPPLDPPTPPEEPSGPCTNQVTVFDRMRTTIEQDASRSTAVVIGTVTGVGKARWNTPDGRPAGGSDLVASRVLRLLRVDVETVAKGSTPGIITVWIPGGLIGCHGFFIGDFGDPQVGSRYVFFLDGSAPSAKVDGVTGAWQMWSVEDGLVQTSFEGRVPFSTLFGRVRTSSRPSASPIASCAVTSPNGAAPPDGPVESVHLGNGKIGTDIWPNGIVIARSDWIQPDGSIALKWGWWRGSGVVGLIDIEGRRLGDPAPSFVAQSPAEGYGRTGFTPSDLIFPGPGCWEVTGHVGEASLTFVTLVVLP